MQNSKTCKFAVKSRQRQAFSGSIHRSASTVPDRPELRLFVLIGNSCHNSTVEDIVTSVIAERADFTFGWVNLPGFRFSGNETLSARLCINGSQERGWGRNPFVPQRILRATKNGWGFPSVFIVLLQSFDAFSSSSQNRFRTAHHLRPPTGMVFERFLSHHSEAPSNSVPEPVSGRSDN